jgi:uncharacterized Ntn-hydrolase superfamily protein
MNIATFSVVGRSKDGKQIGVAVASRFLAVGSYVPAATIHGALATQANTNMALRVEGLAMLEQGIAAREILEKFFKTDPQKNVRQAGIVDANGTAATFTGEDCPSWAGGRAEAHPSGSFAIQGNILAGPEVIDSMVAAWCDADASIPLAWRLLACLEAGQAAGGDSRGKQASALYVIEKGKGFNGTSDVAVDLRCDDSATPIQELRRLLELHDALFESKGS